MLYKIFLSLLSDKFVGKKYQKHGTMFGDAVSMLYMGECVGFKKLFLCWKICEAEYLKRGFRSLSVDEFVGASYGHDIGNRIMVRRNSSEKPVFHALIYEELYLGKVEKTIHLDKVMQGEVQIGYWQRPSTEDAIKHNV